MVKDAYNPDTEDMPVFSDEPAPVADAVPVFQPTPAAAKGRPKTNKIAKTYKVPAVLAEALSRKVAELRAGGVVVELSEAVSWGIERALEDLGRGTASEIRKGAK